MAEALHNVSFQAAKTNSSQASPPIVPPHIEKGLLGETGTTRPPKELWGISRFLGKFITLFVFVGVLWLLRQTPVVAFVLATILACISLSMSGLFFGIPYLKQRRSEWTEANRWLLIVSMIIVWGASMLVAWPLVFNPPKAITSLRSMLSSLMVMDNRRRIEEIKAQLWRARYDCDYRGCDSWRASLERKLAKAQEPQQLWLPSFDGEAVDDNVVFAILSVVLGLAVGIAAHGGSFASETTNAIWREPQAGYANNPAASPAPTTEEPSAKLKRRGFDLWLKNNISIGGDSVLPVDVAYGDYKKYLDNSEKHVVAPPSYNLFEFKDVFRSMLGKEPVAVNGTLCYQGVSFAGGGLI